jgi:predicted RNase H-like nuclease (RuvC/YqgF family)
MNRSITRLRAGAATLAVAACVLALPVQAQSVDSVLSAERKRIDSAAEAQNRIDRIASQTRSITDEYKTITKEIDGLKVYNRLLTAQTDKQQAKLDEIDVSMDRATMINRQIFPLMTDMVASLEQSIALDVPFLMEERTNRVQLLKDLMDEPDVSPAEKFRKVMEAYQIEIDFGRTIESYQDTLELNDKILDVEFLRIGRVALLFQNPDGSVTGRWNNETRSFELVDDYRAEVEKGLAVANKRIAPELLLLPVSGSESI